ncbi:MAG: YCF48-related protein [Ignavibacteriaceae bacterium]|nr:YCF48-related protein [Ignavibacteriaceae bacterium]
MKDLLTRVMMISLMLISEWTSIKAQQPDSTQEQIHYKRNDSTFLENYNPNDKAKYFPLNKVTAGTGVWTELNPNVPRVDYIGVDFINPDTGWAVGLWGAAIKTTNGGQNWQTLETPTGEILLKVHSYNGQVVMVVGHNGTILRSSDSGDSFTELTGITTQELWGVRMLNDTLGWICGRNNTLLKTTDSGLTWQNITTGFNYHYWQFDFLSEEYFMIACSQGRVLKTTNGGLSFTQYQAGSAQDLYTIDIIDSLHIAAAGNFGKNVYSSDGGVTWTENQYTSLSINWIQYINRDTGYITIGTISSFYKTTNRGQSWFNPGFNGTGEWQFELLNESLGYGVGAGLKITKTEDGYTTGRNLILNVDFRDVYFFTETTGFALSWFLYKTTDGGISWQRNENAPGGYDILFLDNLTGFIGGTERLFKTTNGGVFWYEPNGIPAETGHINKIFFINSSIGWAIKSRNILKTTDGGENWFVQFTHINDSFTSIYFVDSLNGWATSRYVHQTTDGGLNWVQRTDIQIYLTDDVYFSNPDIGWIGKYSSINNSLFKTTDGGLNWFAISEVIGARKFYFFPNPVHWVIIGFSQYYITNDFGNSWLEFTEEVPAGLISFYAPTNNLGYAGGSLGLFLRYNDTTYIPVELISFTASVKNDNVLLEWITASEINNYGFEIQRALENGIWEKISFIPGKGTTTNTSYYSFIDYNTINKKISYRLKQIDYNGEFEFSNVIEIEFDQPVMFSLHQNFPNPFNPSTQISFEIPFQSDVKIVLYDITGKELKTLISQHLEAGFYTVPLVAKDLSSGVYFYRMTSSSGYTAVKKLTIIK